MNNGMNGNANANGHVNAPLMEIGILTIGKPTLSMALSSLLLQEKQIAITKQKKKKIFFILQIYITIICLILSLRNLLFLYHQLQNGLLFLLYATLVYPLHRDSCGGNRA